MSIWSAIGSIAAPIIGGLFQSDAEDKREESAARQQEENTKLQREFAQQGIRWRVEDAKAAGLHPLYAIGGSGASYSPNPVVVGSGASAMSEMGQNVARAAFAAADPHTRELQAAQLDVLKAAAAKDYALAAAASSEAARARQGNGQSAPIPLIPPPSASNQDVGNELDVTAWARGRAEDLPLKFDAIKYKPDDAVSASGTHPYATAQPGKASYSEYQFPGGFRMMLPAGSSMSEAVESLGESPMFALMVIRHNMEHYGPGWGRTFAKQFPGLRSLIETGEDLSEPLGRILDRWFPQMPAAKAEFGEGKIPAWYRKPRFDLNRSYDRWSIRR